MTTTTRTLSDGRQIIVTTERHSYRTRVYAYVPGAPRSVYVGSLMRPACPENIERISKGLSRLYRAGFSDTYGCGKSWEGPVLYKTSRKAVDFLVSKAQEEGLV
jgi:hypothetical protein